MGFDAKVYCNCFKEGKTKLFPLPELVQYIVFDSEMQLDFNPPRNEMTSAAVRIFDEWLYNNPCEHDALAYCRVHLGTNKGYWHFHKILEQNGWDHFPTLKTNLPKANGGYMPAKDTPLALAELNDFNQLTDLGTDVALAVANTNEIIWEHAGIWTMQFDKAGVGVNLGIDKQGFFIAPSGGEKAKNTFDIYGKALDVASAKQFSPNNDALFRAWRFEQRLLESKPESKVEYHNLDSGQRFISEFPINLTFQAYGADVDERGDNHLELPQNLIVQEYTVRPSHFAYIVKPLIQVCEASIATGNPVVWS